MSSTFLPLINKAIKLPKALNFFAEVAKFDLVDLEVSGLILSINNFCIFGVGIWYKEIEFKVKRPKNINQVDHMGKF